MFIGANYSQLNNNLMLFVNWGLRQVQINGMSITTGVHHHQKLEHNPHSVVISVHHEKVPITKRVQYPFRTIFQGQKAYNKDLLHCSVGCCMVVLWPFDIT